MVTLRLLAVSTFCCVLSLPAQAEVFAFEVVPNGGRNDAVDSNSSSCDSVEGCFTATGTRCSDDPNELCNLQTVPAGRCTYGNLATGLASCVWPHRAGRCSGNIKVGCLTSAECAGLSPSTCDLTFDKFGRPADPNDTASCTCTEATAITVCSGSLSVCSDGDLLRGVGGYGPALGMELKLGAAGSQTFPALGPAVTGSSIPDSSPSYAIENPPSVFDPQRDAGSVGRTIQGTGEIRAPRTTDARDIAAYVHPTIATPVDVRKVTAFGDSYWSDWAFSSVIVTATFNTHIVSFTCNPPVGWVVGTPVNGAGQHCHQAARNGLGFYWDDPLTAEQLDAYTIGGVPVCPPNCYKDFDLSTTELQELNELAQQDPNAAIQVAIQSGEPDPSRRVGSHDAIDVSVVNWMVFLVDNDLRCRIGGWGNPAGVVGRCSDGASACDPDGPPTCAGQGGSCRACAGPFDATTNPLGLPIGYNAHGRAELDLVVGQRVGGIAGTIADVRIPLVIVGTTGSATADFRDIANEGSPDVDLADLGPVDPDGAPFGSGIGAGGTFANGSLLHIDEPCCSGGVDVAWDAAQLGEVMPGLAGAFDYRYGPGVGDVHFSDWALTYDKGPGPDGIPGCIGDNRNGGNGQTACDQRLGFGVVGAKTNGFFATGQDDRALRHPVGPAMRPASAAKFQWDHSTVIGAEQQPPWVNTVAAFTVRDLTYFISRSADLLVKLNTTVCPLTDQGPQCDFYEPESCEDLGGTDFDGCCCYPSSANSDGDSVCDECDNCLLVTNETQVDGDGDLDGDVCDNCPTIANPLQEDGAAGLEITIAGVVSPDGVGDVCDNCVRVTNPRVIASFLTTNPWATLTGGQRDDDHDGYGNRCDAKFVGLPSAAVGGLDLGQYRASSAEDRRFDTCGTTNVRPCAIWDLDEAAPGNAIGGLDFGRFRQLNAAPPGPRCAECTGTGSVPLPCTAGTAGECF